MKRTLLDIDIASFISDDIVDVGGFSQSSNEAFLNFSKSESEMQLRQAITLTRGLSLTGHSEANRREIAIVIPVFLIRIKFTWIFLLQNDSHFVQTWVYKDHVPTVVVFKTWDINRAIWFDFNPTMNK